MHPDGDVTIVGRVASGAEIVAGESVHVYGRAGRVIAGISGSPSAPRLLQGGAGRTPVHRRLLCHRRNYEPCCLRSPTSLLTRYKGQLKLEDWGFAIARRSTMRKARVALARRLAIIMHAMLRDGTAFISA